MHHEGSYESSPNRAPLSGLRFLVALIVLTLVYWIGARSGLYLKASFGDVTPIWPPSGLAVAVFLAWGIRYWPMVAIGEFAAAISIHQPPIAGVIGGCAQIAEALAACWLLRLAGVGDITATARSVMRFTAFGAAIPPLVASLLGTIGLFYVGALDRADLFSGFLTWWMGDAIGILVLTPVLTRLARERRVPLDKSSAPILAAFVLVMILIGLAVTQGFGSRGPYLFFLLLPLVVVGALRFGLTGASAGALLLTLMVYGLRPQDVEHGDFLTAVRMLFVGISAFTAYLIAGFMKERAASAARLRDMTMAMQQAEKMHALGTLAGGVAHDFNNLIGIIRGHADLALLAHEDGPDGKVEHLRQIRQACDHAAELVKRILTFSRDRASSAHCIDVAPLVRDIVELFRRSLPVSTECRLTVDADRSQVNCAEAQIHQIAMNLLSNAHHALPDGQGQILVRVTNRTITDSAHVAPRARSGEYLVIEVADTGAGIPKEILDRIFEPYFTTKSPGRGTGLGLSVVHGIVQELGGFIEIDSAVGQGTTMRVHLPLESPDPAHAA